MDVGAHVAAGSDPAECGVAPAVAQRPAVHQEQSSVPVFRLGEVLLSDHVAVASDRIDDLIQIRDIVRANEEHAVATRSLQRLEHALALVHGRTP